MVLYQKTIAIELVEMCITFKKHLRRLTRRGGNEHKVFLRKQPSRKTFLGCYSARLAKMELWKTRNLLQHSLFWCKLSLDCVYCDNLVRSFAVLKNILQSRPAILAISDPSI